MSRIVRSRVAPATMPWASVRPPAALNAWWIRQFSIRPPWGALMSIEILAGPANFHVPQRQEAAGAGDDHSVRGAVLAIQHESLDLNVGVGHVEHTAGEGNERRSRGPSPLTRIGRVAEPPRTVHNDSNTSLAES